MANVGTLRALVAFQRQTAVPDGDGGTVVDWITLPPVWPMAIEPASVRNLELAAASTILAVATHILSGRYRGDVDLRDRITWGSRVFEIAGIQNLSERGIDMRIFGIERL